MTPTLWGRWQNRFFLLGTFGLLVTLLYGFIYQNYTTPLAVLGYVFLFGLGWDIIYQAIVHLRWDGDWPTSFQIAAGVLEGVWVWVLVHYIGLPYVDKNLPLRQFIPHYGTVWLVIFIITQGPLRALLPRWRYYGGKWF